MKKFAVKLLCCFIPSRHTRHVLRHKLNSNGDVDWTQNHVWLIAPDGKRRQIRSLYHCEFNFSGVNNNVYLYEPVDKLHLKINVSSNVNIIIHPVRQEACAFIRVYRSPDGCDKVVNLNIGAGLSTSQPMTIEFAPGGAGDVTIGDDCMFSWNVNIHNGDHHAIVNLEKKKVLNHNEAVRIGNHVWVGCGVTFWKGAKVSDNSVVGTHSLVTSKFNDPNVVIAGVPAKVIKTGINWDRKSPSAYEDSL